MVYEKKILTLYSESHPKHGESGWFVVTGGVEENENYEKAVSREVMEETGLSVGEVFPLNCGSIYVWDDKVYEEHNFVSFVHSKHVVLNEEHSKYEWLNINKFIKIIKWDDDKKLLEKVLKKALNKENHFKEFTIKDYRKEKNE